MNWEWSDRQRAVFDAVLNGAKHLVIDSRAGSSKTTTAVEAVRRYIQMYPTRRVLVSAYNNRIRDELTARFIDDVRRPTVLGLNQIGFALVRGAFRGIDMFEDKGQECARAATLAAGFVGARDPKQPDLRLAGLVERLATWAKCTLAGSIDQLRWAAEDLGLVDDEFDADTIADVTREALARAIQDTARCDFDDQIWFPPRFDLRPREPFDLVVGDEAQDFNAANLWTVRRMVKPDGGRIVLIGDENQAVYGFRGAEGDGMRKITAELGADVLKLTRCYRCPKAVVRSAARFVPDFEPAPDAIEGIVKTVDYTEMLDYARPGDVVLSRLRAPLVGTALALVRSGRPACVMGRDFVERLTATIARSGAATVEALIEWCETSRDREFTRLSKNEKLARRAEDVKDTYDALIQIANGASTVGTTKQLIQTMFSDRPGASIVCSTVHKSKGLEWQNVWLLVATFRTDRDEERRIRYVAETRSREKLFFVRPPRPNTSPAATLRTATERAELFGVAADASEPTTAPVRADYFDLSATPSDSAASEGRAQTAAQLSLFWKVGGQ